VGKRTTPIVNDKNVSRAELEARIERLEGELLRCTEESAKAIHEGERGFFDTSIDMLCTLAFNGH
jgi:hypothetical protein